MSVIAQVGSVSITKGGSNPSSISYQRPSPTTVSFTITPPIGYVFASIDESSTGPGSSTLTELIFGQSYIYFFDLDPISVYTITVITFAPAEDYLGICSMGVNDLTATLIIDVR
jgi:hypothetical protein